MASRRQITGCQHRDAATGLTTYSVFIRDTADEDHQTVFTGRDQGIPPLLPWRRSRAYSLHWTARQRQPFL